MVAWQYDLRSRTNSELNLTFEMNGDNNNSNLNPRNPGVYGIVDDGSDNDHFEDPVQGDEPPRQPVAGLGSQAGENFSDNGGSLRDRMDTAEDVTGLTNRMNGLNISYGKFQPKPPAPFAGERRDAMAVDNWLDRIEDLQLIHNAQDDLSKVLVAKFHLMDEALRWYRRHNMRQASWDQFKFAFKKRFYPEMMFEKEHAKFMRLKQTGSVEGYNNAFNKSLDLLADCYTLPMSVLKQQYCQGLFPRLALAVRTALPLYQTLEEVQSAALEIEIGQRQVDFAENRQLKSVPPKKTVNNVNVDTSDKNRCMRDGLCFNCKQKGHISRFCPLKKEQPLKEMRQ